MADTIPTERWQVTMRSIFALPNGDTATHEATDHVATADLDAYVADARTRWQAVVVSDTPDPGPGGADGAYVAPTALEG